MQLNIYVPKRREKLVKEVEQLAKKQRCSKNEIILLALEEYLSNHRAEFVKFGVYELRAKQINRRELYGQYLDRKMPREKLLALTTEANPVLAELWNN